MKQNQELLELNQSVLQGQIRPERSESFNALDNIEGLECKICFERNCVKESLPVNYILEKLNRTSLNSNHIAYAGGWFLFRLFSIRGMKV